MKRLNKEYKLDVCSHVVVKYGSVNKDNPQVVYVSGRCWVSPQIKMNYDDVIYHIEKEMRKNIKLFLMDGINFDKKFLSFDFYLRQNEANKKSLKGLKNILNGRISTVVNNLVYLFKENDFTIEKRK